MALCKDRIVGILIRLGISALALWIATLIVPGISLETASLGGAIGTLVAVAVIFGVVNAVLRPLIKVVGCGFYLLTLGLIALVVNGLLFMLTGWIAGELNLPFVVDGFWPAVFGALLVSIVSWALNLFVPDGDD
ncbi:phage holin family protein [Catenuloplanes indicus JCM 9534]